jgi:hypothetical protein
MRMTGIQTMSGYHQMNKTKIPNKVSNQNLTMHNNIGYQPEPPLHLPILSTDAFNPTALPSLQQWHQVQNAKDKQEYLTPH